MKGGRREREIAIEQIEKGMSHHCHHGAKKHMNTITSHLIMVTVSLREEAKPFTCG